MLCRNSFFSSSANIAASSYVFCCCCESTTNDSTGLVSLLYPRAVRCVRFRFKLCQSATLHCAHRTFVSSAVRCITCVAYRRGREAANELIIYASLIFPCMIAAERKHVQDREFCEGVLLIFILYSVQLIYTSDTINGRRKNDHTAEQSFFFLMSDLNPIENGFV